MKPCFRILEIISSGIEKHVTDDPLEVNNMKSSFTCIIMLTYSQFPMHNWHSLTMLNSLF